MYKTLYIDVPNAQRCTYLGVVTSLSRYGFEVPQASERHNSASMRITAVVRHCTGDIAGAANEFWNILPSGSRIRVDHANPFH